LSVSSRNISRTELLRGTHAQSACASCDCGTGALGHNRAQSGCGVWERPPCAKRHSSAALQPHSPTSRQHNNPTDLVADVVRTRQGAAILCCPSRPPSLGSCVRHVNMCVPRNTSVRARRLPRRLARGRSCSAAFWAQQPTHGGCPRLARTVAAQRERRPPPAAPSAAAWRPLGSRGAPPSAAVARPPRLRHRTSTGSSCR